MAYVFYSATMQWTPEGTFPSIDRLFSTAAFAVPKTVMSQIIQVTAAKYNFLPIISSEF